MRNEFALAAMAVMVAACTRNASLPPSPESVEWSSALAKARNTRVNFAMWAGDEERNRYMRGTVTPAVKSEFGIDLHIVPAGDTAEVINKLLNEKSAGKVSDGSIDVLWINGENFRTARQGHLLWGPFANKLPNLRLYDSRQVERDFGTPVEGWEAPWQRAQFVFAYDPSRVSEPPGSIRELGEWAKNNPGRFTYIAPPDFTGSAFIRHVLLHFSEVPLDRFDRAVYERASNKAIDFLMSIKPYLWRRGETYPPSPRELDRLFGNREVDFTMNYSPAFASVRIERGEFPPGTRTFVFNSGTIGNFNFLAIPFNASNVEGAMVVINHLMSFDRLLDFSRALRIQFPLSPDRLTADQRRAVEALPRGVATLPDDVLARHFIPEPDAAYLQRFERDWEEKVLRK
jgi:putative spermidine/putrescine transport system substrate-binding protein